MTITLHSELGVNPRLMTCPRCGKDTNELALIGNNDSVSKCRNCGMTGYGRASSLPKSNKGCTHDWRFERKLQEYEKLPGSLCDDCQKEMDEHAAIVAKGGVYWRCTKCNRSGVIRAESGFSRLIRQSNKLDLPDRGGKYKPCGVEFTEEQPCPVCAGLWKNRNRRQKNAQTSIPV